MSDGRPHVLVTGADGFIGRSLVDRLLVEPQFSSARLTLNDLALQGAPSDACVRASPGDFCDPAVRADMIGDGVDVLFHVGGMLGGASESDPARARAVNLEATLALFEAIGDPARPPRIVFASSIAVFGSPLPRVIDDDTRPNPSMNYGAHKAMVEIAVEQASARGWIDGLALRLPGVVVKPGADERMKAAFLNRLFEVFREGRDLTLPVSAEGTTWLLSTAACVDALLHAGTIRADRLGTRRAFTLPAQNVRFSELVATLHARWPQSPTTISYAPDEALEAQFGRQPPLTTRIADALGFRHDGDVDTLVARAVGSVPA